jgi:hypothetical protein
MKNEFLSFVNLNGTVNNCFLINFELTNDYKDWDKSANKSIPAYTQSLLLLGAILTIIFVWLLARV